MIVAEGAETRRALGPAGPTLSIVIPARNAASDLDRCLLALRQSLIAPDECIVVDDGSADETAAVASRYGARLLCLGTSRGPAFARNRGAEIAVGDILFFVDADVCLAPDAISGVLADFRTNEGLAAVMGSYDDEPGDGRLISQYKNLTHHFVHQHAAEEASTFWSGCGAVRRSIFLELGGFDENYRRPCIEDIELGRRLCRRGYRIRLNKQVQGKHLKYWSLSGLIRTDIVHRGIPWVSLMLRDRAMQADLNLTWTSRASTALVYLLLVSVILAITSGHAVALIPLSVLLAGCFLCAAVYRRVGEFSSRGVAVLSGCAVTIATAIAGWSSFWAVAPVLFLASIVALNAPYYLFVQRKRGIPFALAILPLHLLYFVYSGACIPLGIVAHLSERTTASPKCAS